MENIVLYQSLEELLHKLQLVRADSTLADNIAAAGQQLVEQHYSWEKLGADVAAALRAPLRRKLRSSILGFKRYRWAAPEAGM
jgi:hypothetical protein